MKPEHHTEPDRHIRVRREIKVDLQRVGKGSQPGRRDRGCAIEKENIVCELRDIVCDKHFLRKTIDEAHHAVRKVIPVLSAFHDFLLDPLIAHDRSRDQLWKKRDIEADIQHTLLRLRPAPVHIKEVGQELEGEKGNPDGERERNHAEVLVQKESQLLHGEGQIFEDKEQSHMKENGQHKNALPLLHIHRRLELSRRQPADKNREQHQEDKDRLP